MSVCLFIHPSVQKQKSPSLSESFLSAIMLVSASLCISLYLSGSFCISLHFSGFLWISQILAIITISHHAFQPISYHTHQPSSTSTLTLLPISHHAYKPSCQSAFIPTICNYAYQKSCHQTSSLTAIIPKLLSVSACFNPAIIQRMPSKCICISVEWYFRWKWPCRKWPSRMSFQVNTF